MEAEDAVLNDEPLEIVSAHSQPPTAAKRRTAFLTATIQGLVALEVESESLGTS